MADKKPSSNINQASAYMRFSGLAIQMGLTIGLGTWLGVWIDGKWETKPIFSVIFSLSSIALAFYALFKEILVDKKKKSSDE